MERYINSLGHKYLYCMVILMPSRACLGRFLRTSGDGAHHHSASSWQPSSNSIDMYLSRLIRMNITQPILLLVRFNKKLVLIPFVSELYCLLFLFNRSGFFIQQLYRICDYLVGMFPLLVVNKGLCIHYMRLAQCIMK